MRQQEVVAQGALVPEAQERRVYQRSDLRFEVHFWVIDEEKAMRFMDSLGKLGAKPGRRGEAQTENVSRSGFGLSGSLSALKKHPVERGDFLALNIVVPGSRTPLRGVGQAQWLALDRTRDLFRMGVEVLGVHPRDLDKLNAEIMKSRLVET